MWKSQRKWLFLPLACSFWLFAGSSSQAETMYQISESEERADRIEENERRDAEIVRECKSILATIRGRGEERH